MPPTGREDLIERFRQGADAVSAALEGLRDGEVDAAEAPGEWSVRQIVHHLADTELMRGARLFRLLTHDHPAIDEFDEGAFAERLHYERDVDSSLAAFVALRESLSSLLKRLSEEEWRRAGVHTELGLYGVETVVERGVSHAADHAEQIRRARSP
jgi:hypothetical protein